MPPAIRVAYFYVTFTLACFVSNISTQNAQTPAISNQSSNVLVEKNATTRTVLTMIASSSFVSVMNMRNASKQSAGSANIRAMFSIVPHDVCLAKRLHCDDSITQFQIVNQTADNFYVESVLTSNEDLNTICTPKEKHDHISFIFYPGHAVFPEGTQTFKSYQVWYKCGLFEPEDYGKKSAEGRGILRSISKMLKCLGYMVMTIAILAVIVQLCRLSYRPILNEDGAEMQEVALHSSVAPVALHSSVAAEGVDGGDEEIASTTTDDEDELAKALAIAL